MCPEGDFSGLGDLVAPGPGICTAVPGSLSDRPASANAPNERVTASSSPPTPSAITFIASFMGRAYAPVC